MDGKINVFGPKRGHFLYIFDNSLRYLGILALVLICGLIFGNLTELIKENFTIVLLILFLPCYRIIAYLTTYLEVSDEKVSLSSGWIFKKATEIPASSVTTIDFSQDILQQLAGVYKIIISNTSNMSASNSDSVIKVVFSKEDAQTIAFLLGKTESFTGANIVSDTDEDNGKGSVNRIHFSKIILLGLLKSKIALLIEGIAVLAFAFGFLSDRIIDSMEASLAQLSTLVFICVCILFLVLVFVFELILTAVRYYDFTVTDDEDKIRISYGLFTKKQIGIMKGRISGFSYEQSFLMKLFGVGTLSVFSVGFSSDEGACQNAMVHPLLKKEDVNSYIAEFTSVFEKDCELIKAQRPAFRFFFGRPVFIASCIIAAICLFLYIYSGVSFYFLGFVPAILSAFGRIQEYINTKAGGNDRKIVLVSGGYTKKTTYIRTDNVETVTLFGSIWKIKKGFASIKIDFLGDETLSTECVYNLDINTAEEIKSLLIF